MFKKEGKMNQHFVTEQVPLHEINIEINKKGYDVIISYYHSYMINLTLNVNKMIIYLLLRKLMCLTLKKKGLNLKHMK